MMNNAKSPIGQTGLYSPLAPFRHLSITIALPIVIGLLLWAPAALSQIVDQGASDDQRSNHSITIDGWFDDWSDMEPDGLDIYSFPSVNETKTAVLDLGRVWVTHDDSWLYLCWENGLEVNIQGLDGSLSIRLNVDGDNSTGIALPLGQPLNQGNTNTAALAGIDIDLRFSPRENKQGARATAYVSDHDPIGSKINPYLFSAAFAPTYASNQVEMRLRRGAIEPESNRSSNPIHSLCRFIRIAPTRRLDPSGTIIDHTSVITHTLSPLPDTTTEPDEPSVVPSDQHEIETATPSSTDDITETDTTSETEQDSTTKSSITEITGQSETESNQLDSGQNTDSVENITSDPDEKLDDSSESHEESIVEITHEPESTVEPQLSPPLKKPTFVLEKNLLLTKVRFVSWNVERGYIFQNPDPFARILSALDPDVICFQELGYQTTAEELTNWLNQYVPGGPRHGYEWETTVMNDTGTGIATRLSNTPIGPKQMPTTTSDGKRRLRATTLLVGGTGPYEDRRIAVVSTHLKCCGRAGDRSDDRRVIEADHIHRILRGIRYDANPSAIVIMGDFNLVGSRQPLEAMMIDDDLDASDLLDVAPNVLGDRINTTWRDPNQPFCPARLDYALISDSSLNVVTSFLLDTEKLDLDTLLWYGLEPDDTTKASDHLPSVVDVSW